MLPRLTHSMVTAKLPSTGLTRPSDGHGQGQLRQQARWQWLLSRPQAGHGRKLGLHGRWHVQAGVAWAVTLQSWKWLRHNIVGSRRSLFSLWSSTGQDCHLIVTLAAAGSMHCIMYGSCCHCVGSQTNSQTLMVLLPPQVTQMQLTGDWSAAQVTEGLRLAMGGCQELRVVMRQTLLEAALGRTDDGGEEDGMQQ